MGLMISDRLKGKLEKVFMMDEFVTSFLLFVMDQVINEKRGSKTASLKDLCPEDKRRIANLIKELAR